MKTLPEHGLIAMGVDHARNNSASFPSEKPSSSHLLPTYARAPLAFERGEGVWLYDNQGRAFLDFGSGVAVNSLGHAHPALVAALTTQAHKLWHVSNLYTIPEGERLAERLCALTFADRVFFTNSGAEAIECAIKMARKFHTSQGAPERFRILTFEGAFHGRTLATIAAGGNPKYLEGFGPKVDGFDHMPLTTIEEIKAALLPETGAILVEPIQGEGGVRVVDVEMLRALRHLCDENGLLLIFDEVQSGMGRSGRLFAHEWAGIVPDIMAAAKGIGGGFPLGACLASEHAAQGMKAGSHGSTYGGNPLAMAVGNAVLDQVAQPEFMAHVNRMAGDFNQHLAALRDLYPDVVEEIRGQGLLLGLKLVVNNLDFITKARDLGLLLVAAGDNVVRLLPPLIVSTDEIHHARKCLEEVCKSLSAAQTR